MNESKLVYRSIKSDKNDNYLRIEIVEKESAAVLTEGTLGMLIVKDLSDGQLFAISPVALKNNFKIEKIVADEPENEENSELDDLMEILNALDKALNSSKND